MTQRSHRDVCQMDVLMCMCDTHISVGKTYGILMLPFINFVNQEKTGTM